MLPWPWHLLPLIQRRQPGPDRLGRIRRHRLLAWKLIAWRRTYLVVTSLRVILITGILTRQIAMMPLAKIADIQVEQPLPGRLLGYGTFLIEARWPGHPLSNIAYIPLNKISIAITSDVPLMIYHWMG